jgi:RTX calcium-binding nonapeptide repeat (4 copies)
MKYAFVLLAAAVSLLTVSAAYAQEEPVLCGDVEATIVGTEGPDKLTGTNGPDVIAALGGDDVINAST